MTATIEQGRRARTTRILAALAIVVATVQFGVVQHSIEAAPQHADSVCGQCLAADHTTPILPDAVPAAPRHAGGAVPGAAPVAFPLRSVYADHPVRAPPATA